MYETLVSGTFYQNTWMYFPSDIVLCTRHIEVIRVAYVIKQTISFRLQFAPWVYIVLVDIFSATANFR